jgi:tetratricopeptide (TPR) repeat protein
MKEGVRKYWFVCCTLVLSILLPQRMLASDQSAALQSANEAYANEDFELALDGYSQLIADGYYSSGLFYNAGNAYYRNGEIGEAIWAYEKALKVDPSNKDAQGNLKFVNQKTDGIDNSSPGVGTWLQSMLFGPRINLWSWLSILSSGLFSISLVIYFTAKGTRKKTLGLFLGGIFGLVLVFTTITAHQHKLYIVEQTQAIVISPQAEVRTSPVDKAKVSFTLKEGDKVQLLGGSKGWIQVEINENTGWVKETEIWKI